MEIILNPIPVLKKIGLVHAQLNSILHGTSPLFFSTDDGDAVLRTAVVRKWITFDEAVDIKIGITGIDFSANGDSPRITILQAIKESEVGPLVELVDSNFFNDLKEETADELCASCGKVHAQIPTAIYEILSALFGVKVEPANAGTSDNKE